MKIFTRRRIVVLVVLLMPLLLWGVSRLMLRSQMRSWRQGKVGSIAHAVKMYADQYGLPPDRLRRLVEVRMLGNTGLLGERSRLSGVLHDYAGHSGDDSDYLYLPSLWLAGDSSRPIVIENITTDGGYVAYSDGSIKWVDSMEYSEVVRLFQPMSCGNIVASPATQSTTAPASSPGTDNK